MLFTQLPPGELLCVSAVATELKSALETIGDRFGHFSNCKDAPMSCSIVSEAPHPDSAPIIPQLSAHGILNLLDERKKQKTIRYPAKPAIDTGVIEGWEICLIRFDDVPAALIKAAWVS